MKTKVYKATSGAVRGAKITQPMLHREIFNFRKIFPNQKPTLRVSFDTICQQRRRPKRTNEYPKLSRLSFKPHTQTHTHDKHTQQNTLPVVYRKL